MDMEAHPGSCQCARCMNLKAESGFLRPDAAPLPAPDGKAWSCPDCKFLATLGENIVWHRHKTGHGKAVLIDIPDPVQGRPDAAPPKEPTCDHCAGEGILYPELHEGSEPSYPCPYCQVAPPTHGTFRRQRTAHTGSSSFGCYLQSFGYGRRGCGDRGLRLRERPMAKSVHGTR